MTFSDYIGTNSKGQDTKCILSYALSNFAVVDQFHIFHILIKNGTHHEALSEFYEEIQEALDAVAEHAVARYGEDFDLIPYDLTKDLLLMNDRLLKFDIDTKRIVEFMKNSTDQGIVDALAEVQEQIEKLMYKLRMS